MQRIKVSAIATVIAAGWLTALSADAQSSGDVSGAGGGAFPEGTTFNALEIDGLQFGVGAHMTSSGLGAGDLHVTLLGTSALGAPLRIAFDGAVTSVSVSDDTALLTGTGTLDSDGDALPAAGVPFTMSATRNALALTISTTALPQVALSEGAVTIR